MLHLAIREKKQSGSMYRTRELTACGKGNSLAAVSQLNDSEEKVCRGVSSSDS